MKKTDDPRRSTECGIKKWIKVLRVVGVCGVLLFFFSTNAVSRTPKLQNYIIDPSEITQIHPLEKKSFPVFLRPVIPPQRYWGRICP